VQLLGSCGFVVIRWCGHGAVTFWFSGNQGGSIRGE
jgi:hypothetical protein